MQDKLFIFEVTYLASPPPPFLPGFFLSCLLSLKAVLNQDQYFLSYLPHFPMNSDQRDISLQAGETKMYF